MATIKSNKPKSVRELGYQILFDFERTRSRIDILESKYLSKIELSTQDRRFIKQLLSGSIRYLLYLDWIIGQLYHGKFSKLLDKTKTILRLALYEIIYLDFVPEHATVSEYVSLAKKKVNPKQGAMVNAILRNYLKQSSQFDPDTQIKDKTERISKKYSFPIWLIDRWIKQWGIKKTEQLCAALNKEPDFDIHINTAKISPEKIMQQLKENDIEFRKSELFDNVFKIKDVQLLIYTGFLKDGLCSVQDESAHIPVELLDIQDGDKVLDMCAAPGGKFIQILQKQISVIAIAVDIDKSRLEKVKENIGRLNLTNGFLVVADGRNLPFKPVFNKILLDAPCSGLGVIGKHPDIKWRRSETEIQSFTKMQSELLEQAGQYLIKKGQMVYSTCTIDIDENENITKKFIENNSIEFKQINPPEFYSHLMKNGYIRTFPDEHSMDGSYCVIIKNF